jgi:hypothetical protein
MMDVNGQGTNPISMFLKTLGIIILSGMSVSLAAEKARSEGPRRGLASYGFSEGFSESLGQAGKMNPLARDTASVSVERPKRMGWNYSLMTPEEKIRFIENQQPRPLRKYVNPYSPTSMNNPFGEGNPYRVDGPSNLFGTGLPFYRLSIGR